MSSQNVPTPQQDPNYSSTEPSENSIMENSVIYFSVSGSSKNGYPYSTNQSLPNLGNSLNCTYPNLPPKSTKSNYRNVLKNNDALSRNNQWRQNEICSEHFMQLYRPNQNVFPNNTNQQYSMVRSREDDSGSGIRVPDSYSAEKRRSIIIQHDENKQLRSILRDDKTCLECVDELRQHIRNLEMSCTEMLESKRRQRMPNILIEQENSDSQSDDEVQSRGAASCPEDSTSGRIRPMDLRQNTVSDSQSNIHSSPVITQKSNGVPNSFSAEDSRLVSILLDENNRLRSKLRDIETRLECVDELGQQLRNLDMLHTEMLESQRRLRIPNFLMEQENIDSQSDDEVESISAASCPVESTSDCNRPMDLRQNTVSDSQSTIPSSPVITQKSNGVPDSFLAENSRLVTILLDENMGLRSIFRDDETRLECVDGLGQILRILDMLYSEVLESQRCLIMLIILMQQVINNSQSDDEVESTDAASCPEDSTSGSNRPMDLRQNTVSDSQSTIPSSQVITQNLNGELYPAVVPGQSLSATEDGLS